MKTRFWLSVMGILNLLVLNQVLAAPPPIPGFEITGTGTLFHFETVTAGVKPPSTKITAAAIASCIMGTGTGCTSSNLEINGGGKAYLFLADTHHGFIATNNTCTSPTELEGLVGGDGSFMFAGQHDLSNTNLLVQGKVTFDKTHFPSLVPTGIKKASLMAVSESLDHYAIGTFNTVGAQFTATCPAP